jgi:hypothetical protein
MVPVLLESELSGCEVADAVGASELVELGCRLLD